MFITKKNPQNNVSLAGIFYYQIISSFAFLNMNENWGKHFFVKYNFNNKGLSQTYILDLLCD